MDISSDLSASYLDTSSFNSNETVASYTDDQNSQLAQMKESAIHNAAVNVSISLESIKAYLNIKSVEISQNTSSAQQAITNIVNNDEIFGFLSGEETQSGLSLSSLGYEGKAITELNPSEAKELISEEGFFGVDETSNRVASFVFTISENNVENLQDSREGIVAGFEAAEKMWGGTLPDISYETQAKTLELIDAKIAELMKTDLDKELENN